MLPPIKIKLLDRDKDMNLSHINPVKIKVREIKNNEQNLSFTHPIKVKICDRDKNMGTAYENKKAKVREKDGTVLVKDKKDILDTDQILEFLSNDYVKPIRIKISTLDLVYNWLYDLLFKFNFATTILAGFAIVIQFGRFVTKLFFKMISPNALAVSYGKPRWILKLWSSVEEALDIFKIEGLLNIIKFKVEAKTLVTITEDNINLGAVKFESKPITKSAVYLTQKRTIEELTTGTIEDQFSGDKTIFDIIYRVDVTQEDPDFYD